MATKGKPLALLLIGLLFGTGFGYLLAAPTPATHDHASHAHIYIDGEKIARAYGPWFHIGATPPEAQTLTVILNANDHSTLAIGDQPFTASIDLETVR